MATKETTQTLIEKRAGVCGGTACIAGTRVPVWAVIAAMRFGVSEEELQTHFVRPLSADEVKAALAYFEENKQEIEDCIRLNEEA